MQSTFAGIEIGKRGLVAHNQGMTTIGHNLTNAATEGYSRQRVELGTMELDYRGIRIEHDQPLKTYLTESPNMPVCELPDTCAAAFVKETKAEATHVLPEAPPPGDERKPVEELPLIAPPRIVPPQDLPPQNVK